MTIGTSCEDGRFWTQADGLWRDPSPQGSLNCRRRNLRTRRRLRASPLAVATALATLAAIAATCWATSARSAPWLGQVAFAGASFGGRAAARLAMCDYHIRVGNARSVTSAAIGVAGGPEVDKSDASDASYEYRPQAYSDMIRSLPGSALADRKVLRLGDGSLRKKAKMVKPERITKENAQNVIAELVRVLRGPDLPGRVRRSGALVAPQLGTTSRLIVVEDTESELAELSAEQRALEGRERPFLKAVFNPRLRPLDEGTSVGWERSASIPGYRALVERPRAVKISGIDSKGQEVSYVAKDWEARLMQQAVDAIDGVHFVDRCLMQSLRHLDAQDDPLPPDCPAVGPTDRPSSPVSEEELIAAAERGGSRGFLAGIPGIGRPNVLLAGSLLLRLRVPAVPPTDVASGAGAVRDIARELRDAINSGKHPLGIAAPQFGKRMRAIAVGESEEFVGKLSARARVQEEHCAFGPLVLFNPVVKRKKTSSEAFFIERSPSVPGYEAVVGRALEVEVSALTEKGEAVSFTAKGWKARMIQHATDVLDGVLYVDRMERRSFRMDKFAGELPEDVPFGVRPVAASPPRKRVAAASDSARRGGTKRTSQKRVQRR